MHGVSSKSVKNRVARGLQRISIRLPKSRAGVTCRIGMSFACAHKRFAHGNRRGGCMLRYNSARCRPDSRWPPSQGGGGRKVRTPQSRVTV